MIFLHSICHSSSSLIRLDVLAALKAESLSDGQVETFSTVHRLQNCYRQKETLIVEKGVKPRLAPVNVNVPVNFLKNWEVGSLQ